MASSQASSLATAVAHAISFLTAKLVARYPRSTVHTLQAALHQSLSAHYAPSWHPADPVRGSARRCMTLSPAYDAPSPVLSACMAAGIRWADWMSILGNKEFEFFVDPGCVAVRADNQIITIWLDESLLGTVPKVSSKTFAQQIVEADKQEVEELFNLLNDEIAAPTWTAPIPSHYPRSTSPLSSLSEPSRCSSRSSNTSSSGFSHYSGDTASSRTSAASASPNTSTTGQFKQSRRERARQARVYVDTNKKEVTPYDGGKTTVLTGGVMLGGAPKAAQSKPKKMAVPNNAMSNSNSWRSVRA